MAGQPTEAQVGREVPADVRYRVEQAIRQVRDLWIAYQRYERPLPPRAVQEVVGDLLASVDGWAANGYAAEAQWALDRLADALPRYVQPADALVQQVRRHAAAVTGG